MKKWLYVHVSMVFLAIVVLTSFAPPSYATGGGNPHKDEEPQKQTLIKKESDNKEDSTQDELREENKTEEKNKNEEKEEYQFELFVEPAKLIKGEAKLTIELATLKGEVVKGATVNALIEMEPNMEGHGKMDSKPIDVQFKFNEETGQYYGDVNFTEVGKYNANFRIDYPDGQSEDFSTELEVIYDGPSLIFLGSIATIMVLSIIAAQIIKNRNNIAKEGTEDARA